jgi:hypothetical protein
MHEALLTRLQKEKYVEQHEIRRIPKGNGISGQRARLALLRRKDKGAREASMGPCAVQAQRSSSQCL